MVSNEVNIRFSVDTSEANVQLDEVEARVDEVTREWAARRTSIYTEVREAFRIISSLMSSFRQALSLFGQQIDPFFSALVGMVISTTSMLISVGTTLVGTGIGATVGAIVLGIAIAFNILTTIKLIADQKEIVAAFRDMMANVKPPSGPQGMVRF